MIVEHLFYSTAVALIAAVVYYHATKKEGLQYAVLIALSAFSPDLFSILLSMFSFLSLNTSTLPGGKVLQLLYHFSHSLGALLLYAFLLAATLFPLYRNFLHPYLFAAIGYGTHLLCDVLAYTEGRIYFWPFYSAKYCIGVLGPYDENFFGIADSKWLFIGILLLVFSMFLYTKNFHSILFRDGENAGKLP